MKKVLTTQVGADGVLTLRVPLGPADANHLVRVIVETVEGETAPAAPPAGSEGWLQFLERIGGTITDPTFERPPQGEYEEREPLS
ncbi:MAG TPA: hypothetical protein VFE78_31610 [Gemmataceae bacterium]|jgi:hypothetical protein|nr:hypothetical protein [Gemmataceae bacterium]